MKIFLLCFFLQCYVFYQNKNNSKTKTNQPTSKKNPHPASLLALKMEQSQDWPPRTELYPLVETGRGQGRKTVGGSICIPPCATRLLGGVGQLYL